jgi:hypothetical protein
MRGYAVSPQAKVKAVLALKKLNILLAREIQMHGWHEEIISSLRKFLTVDAYESLICSVTHGQDG